MEKIERWYRRWGPVIFARCRQLLRNDALAEDATHEIFLRFMRQDQLPADETALRWISSVTRNHCLNQLRARKLHAVPHAELPELGTGDPERELDDRRFARELFSRVPHAVRRPAALRLIEGASKEETALRLGVSLRTISHRMSAFTSSCRALLAARTAELAGA